MGPGNYPVPIYIYYVYTRIYMYVMGCDLGPGP